MAGVLTPIARKKDKYGADDVADEYLLNQVAAHIRYNRLGSLATSLNVSYMNGGSLPTNEHVFRVTNINYNTTVAV